MTMIEVPGMTLALRFKLARLAVGMEQSDVAASLGVSRPTVSNWERGASEPNATTLVRLARLYAQPLDWFAEAVPVNDESPAGEPAGLLRARRDSNPQPSDP